MKKTAFVCAMLALMLGINAQAATITFSGKLNEAEKGKYLTVLALKQGANTVNPEFDDIMWIDQTEIGEDLSYSITVPESLYTMQNRVITNYDIGADSGNLIYVSSSGSSSGNGSEASPYSTLESAVNKANESGDTIVLLDTVTIPSNYTLQADKSVTITGMSPSSGEIVGGLDFSATISARFDLDVTFENMTFTTIPETDSKVNRIFACGRKMVMGRGLTMTNPIELLGGNTSGKTAKNTSVTVYSGDYRRIYGGGWDSETTGDTHITIDGDINSGTSALDSDSANFFDSRVLGGGYNAKSVVRGNTYITFNKGTAAHIIGGGASALVEGDTYIYINGGTVMNVCGGIKNGGLEYSGNSHILMTGGVVESIYGGSEGCNYLGNTSVKVTGGEILRRIYGGCYNEFSGAKWSTDGYVKGTTSVKIGGSPKLITGRMLSTGNKADMGLFASSRRENNSDEENSVFIFTDGCYDTYKQYIGQQTSWVKNDVVSHHDYIVCAASGGDVTAGENAEITLLPNNGKAARIGESKYYEKTQYQLQDAVTSVEFDNCIAIVNQQAESTEKNLSVSADVVAGDQTLFGEGQKLIAAVFAQRGRLIAVKETTITGEDNYSIDFGKMDVSNVFDIRLYIWDFDKFTPLGGYKVLLP